MICTGCQTENRSGRGFCSKCGTALPVVCLDCGFENELGDAFCGGCGTALAASAQSAERPPEKPLTTEPERRQVTILFADLCGFTKLSAALPVEDVHRLIGRFFEVIDDIVLEYGGRVDNHIGDAVMAIFGAPVAHGNDPERAVRAASDIHTKLRELSAELEVPLQAHIGIASGQVVASSIGGAGHSEYTVLGESVNLAARLVDKAGPDDTYLSDAVYGAIPRLLVVESVGDVEVKGLDQAVRIWRLCALVEARATRALKPLFGRHAELRQFQGVLESLRELGQGQAVNIRGEAGIGKSRLVEEFAALAAEEDFACHTALILDFGVG
jgi:class 3 adenylate cyclase